ncbi:MAG: preprotein translocase subunit SecG [Planctomycetota bacterium]|jgi:preprotein translocase subunit SecG
MLPLLLLSLSFVGLFKSVLLFLFFVCALLLVIIILLQEPKGGGLAAAFGGAGAETFGVQSGGVNKFTAYLAAGLMTLAILYAAIRPDAGEESAPTDVGVPGIGAPLDPLDDLPPEDDSGGGGEGDTGDE